MRSIEHPCIWHMHTTIPAPIIIHRNGLKTLFVSATHRADAFMPFASPRSTDSVNSGCQTPRALPSLPSQISLPRLLPHECFTPPSLSPPPPRGMEVRERSRGGSPPLPFKRSYASQRTSSSPPCHRAREMCGLMTHLVVGDGQGTLDIRRWY